MSSTQAAPTTTTTTTTTAALPLWVTNVEESPSTIIQRAPPFRLVDQTFMAGGNSSHQRDAGKLRIREAYARIATEVTTLTVSSARIYHVIPDALAWRMYLPWITQLVKHLKQQQEHRQQQPDNDTIQIQFILLESVAQDLEFRNQYSNQQDNKKPEVAFPQERIRLTRLVQQYPAVVQTFCDLSLRDVDFDECDDIQHVLPPSERLRLQALRAARLLLWQTADENKAAVQVGLWLQQTPVTVLEEMRGTEEGVVFVEPHSLLELVLTNQQESVQPHVRQDFDRLRIKCRDDYQQRQQQTLIRTSRDNTAHTPTTIAFWTESQLNQGVREGKIGRGRYQVSKENPSEAFVFWNGTMWFIASSSSSSLVHAIDQDLVIIQPLAKNKWQQPVGRRRLVALAKEDDDEKDDVENDNATARNADTATVPTARLLSLYQTGTRRAVVATLTAEPAVSDEAAVLVVPMDFRIPKIRLQSRQWNKWSSQRLLVQIDEWDADSRYPSGHVREIIGPVGDLETEISCLLTENRIPMDSWSLQSKACLPREDWVIPPEEIKQRRDLRRTHNIFSVDPVGCQDIDDCMHARRLPNGDVEVGVHIADVTHFVPLHSPLDLQARKRGTTFYLVDRRFDMLPSVLSSNLCSLHGGCDRLAVSVIWTLTEDMSEILTTWYGRTVIDNVAAMTYEQADRILAGQPPEVNGEGHPPPLTAGAPVKTKLIPKLREDLGILTRLAQQRRRDRTDYGGAVDLSGGDTGTELKFLLVDGEPVKVQPKETKEIHKTIEEMMIWANTSVASKIKEIYPDSALLRIHRAVEEERFDDLKSLLTAGDITFKGKTNAELAESLQHAQERSEKTVASLFRSLATRAMSEALYVSTGSIGSATGLAHYGLGLKEYTHFTSPIRRYADVIVHHQLLAALRATGSLGDRGIVALNPRRDPVLASLPDSDVMSVLEAGSSQVTDDENDLEINESIGDAGGELALGSKTLTTTLEKWVVRQKVRSTENAPFNGSEVAEICNHLNEHNRLAKHSSTDCQGLFLSLYFRNNVEYTQAVVTDLRENGFYCYIPKFDMRGPVYLRDMDGNIQIDPTLFDLPRTVGVEPTRGFATTGFIRRFDPSESEIWYKENERLDAYVRCRHFPLNLLDVVMVAITCPDWDNRARVPFPKIQLIRQTSEQTTTIRPKKGFATKNLHVLRTEVKPSLSKESSVFTPRDEGPSLFDLMEEIRHVTHPDDSTTTCRRSRTSGVFNKTVAGRFVWGDFINPDSRAAAQAEAQQAAAALRNDRPGVVVEEYDANTRVAREVTSRQQRLAAEKRNARRSKRN